MIIFTGRFQPFHNGHILMIKQITKKEPNKDIHIGIIKDVYSNEKADLMKKHANV